LRLKKGAKYISENVSVINLAINATSLDENDIKLAASGLLYNISLHFKKDDSDIVLQIISLVISYVEKPFHTETAYRLLLALGHILYNNRGVIDINLVHNLDLSVPSKLLDSSTAKTEDEKRIFSIAQEVDMLLK